MALRTDSLETGKAEVVISALSHWFSVDKHALSDVNLSVRSGEFISLIGPSGCGKTTVLNIVGGLLERQAGSVLVRDDAPRAGRADIAYMLARDALLPWLTVAENAEIGMKFQKVPKASRRTTASRLLSAVGLSGFEGHYPKALSQGMRQRVALARTFALDSPLLLMDEPFGALDAQTKLVLEDVLLDLWEEQRKTVIFVTHDLNEALTLSDRVVVMSRRPGTISSELTVPLPRPRSATGLQKSPEYHELYSQLWAMLEVAAR